MFYVSRVWDCVHSTFPLGTIKLKVGAEVNTKTTDGSDIWAAPLKDVLNVYQRRQIKIYKPYAQVHKLITDVLTALCNCVPDIYYI